MHILAQAASDANAVIITAIIMGGGALITALVKWTPRKHVNGSGELLAKASKVTELESRLSVVESGLKSEKEYNHKNQHRLNNKVNNISLKQALMDQKIDDICDKLKIRRRREDESKLSMEDDDSDG